jgi:hypothetical protein
MARPLRIEFAGALYHVTSRGDGRGATGQSHHEVLISSLAIDVQITSVYGDDKMVSTDFFPGGNASDCIFATHAPLA